MTARTVPPRCLGRTQAGRPCRAHVGLDRLFCRHHGSQGLPCFGGPGDGVRVLVRTVDDVPFAALPDPAGGWLFDRVGPGHACADAQRACYVLADHPLTGRPVAAWRELVHRSASEPRPRRWTR